MLRSGQVATEYFDKCLFEADPVLIRRVAERMTTLVPAGTHFLGGLELGGVALATVLSQLTGLPALFVRKQAKAYGTCKVAEGEDPSGRAVTLVEDVITTGGAVLAAATALRELGATVSAVVCATDRSRPGHGVLADNGISVRAVLTKADLDLASGAADLSKRRGVAARDHRQMSDKPEFTTVTAYLHYPDGDAAADWLSRVLGFGPPDPARIKRDDAGHWQEGELAIGPTRIDISGGREPGPNTGAGALLIVGVTDVDAQYRRIRGTGVAIDPPRDESYGPRACHVTDPWGYQWYFWQGKAIYPAQ